MFDLNPKEKKNIFFLGSISEYQTVWKYLKVNWFNYQPHFLMQNDSWQGARHKFTVLEYYEIELFATHKGMYHTYNAD